MKPREYFRDMDFSHRASIEEEESNQRWIEKHAEERNTRALIRKLYQGGLSKQRIYLTLVEKMKKIWPQNSTENLRNIIDGECRNVDKSRSDNQNKDNDFEDR